MRNIFFKPALIFTILFGVAVFFFSETIFLSFEEPVDMYAENFDIIEHGEGGRIETQLFACTGAFVSETTTTTSKRGGSTSTTDYYYAIPVYDNKGEIYYIAIEVTESNRSMFNTIARNSQSYDTYGNTTFDFDGTIDDLDDDIYQYMLEYFRGYDIYEDESDLRAHVLPLCLDTIDFDIAPAFIVIIIVLLALAILFWILYFKRRSKIKAQSNMYNTNAAYTNGAAMSGATLNGVPINTVPQQSNPQYADAYNVQYNNPQYAAQYNAQYNPQYNTQQSAGYNNVANDSIVINGVPYSRVALSQVNAYVLTGETVMAIKTFREISGLGLAEAKNVIDNWNQNYR